MIDDSSNMNIIFREDDLGLLDGVTRRNTYKTSPTINTNIFSHVLKESNIHPLESQDIDDILNEASLFKGKSKSNSKIRKEFEKALANLKEKHKKGKLVPSDIKRVIHAFYRIPPENLVDETFSVFQLVRFTLLVGVPFIVHPALGLIAWLTNKIIEEKINEAYKLTILNKYRRELDYVKEKLKEPNLTDLEKKNLSNTKRYLEDGIYKLESYFDTITTYKTGDTRDEYFSKSDDGDDDDFDMDSYLNEGQRLDEGGDNMYLTREPETEELMLEQLSECMSQLEEIELSESKRVGKAIKRVADKVERFDRRQSSKVDDVADSVVEGGKKSERKQMQDDIMRGRVKVSTLLKRAVAIGTVVAINPAIGALSAFVWLTRKGYIKKAQKEKLLADLKAEEEILNEKIKDAEADNDKKKKYQYMRLRREVKRSIDKIRYNRSLDNQSY